MTPAVTYPVQVLREHLTGLEAAISVCLAEPEPKPVHRLRTESRRAEALLLLLALVPGLPEHRKQAAAFLKAIAKLRRAAGEVRDFDVHRRMLETLVTREGQSKRGASGAQKAKRADQDQAALSRSADELRNRLGAQRDKAAVALKRLLEKRQVKTARTAENLLAVLEPAEGLPLRAQDVLQDADAVLTRDGLLKPGEISAFSEKDLHTVRKAAKAARYVAEAAPTDSALTHAARSFQSLQDAGGQWHDALELARASRRCFGKRHPLTALFRQERDRKLQTYRAALEARAAADAPTPKRGPSKQSPTRNKAAA